MLDIVYSLISGTAALALLVHARRGGPNSTAWKLIAAGLFAGTLGDVVLTLVPQSGPDPSAATALYLSFYLFTLLGLRRLAGGHRPGPPGIPAVLTAGLGLATLWAWLVFGPMVDDVEGPAGAVANTLAYPFLDLLLLVALLVVLAAHGWRMRGSLVALLAGFVAIAAGNLLWAAETAYGNVMADPAIGALWAAGAVAVAAAARLPAPAPALDGDPDSRLVPFSAAAAMLIACAVLVSTQFGGSGRPIAVSLAVLTLAAATAQLILLYRGSARIERARRELHEVHGASVDAALDCIVTADEESRVREWNPASERTFGYTRDEAIGRKVSELIIPPAHVLSHDRAYERMVSGEDEGILGVRVERIARRADGSEFPVELAVTRVQRDPQLFTAFLRDISVSRKRAEDAERLAAMVRSTEDAMFSCDLEGRILAWNPAAEALYGYSATEAIGTRMRSRLVPSDRMAESIDLLDRVGRGESVARETVRRRKYGELIDVSLRCFPVRDEVGRVTGCAVAARDITDRKRREAQIRAKRERQAWQAHIEEALDADAFEFHAQPVWSLDTRRIHHHELLLRMRMNDEIVRPGTFLPHAESSPWLMRRIDHWTIRRGISLAQRDRVAINLSGTTLSSSGIVGNVREALERDGVDPRNLIFEITETAVAENLDSARTLVSALTEIGCDFALDDFGTGYNSFTYLKHLPVTEIKIDIDFIRGLAKDRADQQVVRSIVAVAENFELRTVAEGVEDEPTLELLTEMGVDCAQGYLLGRPGPDWTRELDLSISRV